MAPESEEKSISEQYEFGDTSHDVAVDNPSESPRVSEATDPPASEERPDRSPVTTPPRDEKGRFQPLDSEPVESSSSPPTHPPRLVRLALPGRDERLFPRNERVQRQDRGLSDEEISSTPTDRLDDIVYHLNRQALRLSREHQAAATRIQSQDRKWSADEPTEPPAQEQVDLGLKEDDYDVPLLGVIKSLKKDLADLKSQTAMERQRKANETVVETLDRIFSAHEDLVGKGTHKDLKADSRDFKRRMAVIATAERDNGKDSFEDKVIRAIKDLYGDSVGDPPPTGREDHPLRRREQEWRNGGLARPTQRDNAAEPTGERKALKTAARIMKEAGQYDDEGLPEDAFPD